MKPNSWVSSSQAKELLKKQLVTWPLARENYDAFKRVEIKSFKLNKYEIKVQFNPSRILSSGAKLDSKSIRERPCFLCPNNLPVEQERLPFGRDYLVLCNPYPLFPEHFTIATRAHIEQSIANRFSDLLEMARRMDSFTLFYNGPRSGASAPDHAHFQAGTRYYMPIDLEVEGLMETNCRILSTETTGTIYELTGYLRNGFIIKSGLMQTSVELFRKIYNALDIKEGEKEPMMNIFCLYKDKNWVTTVIPRKRHRPWQFEADGEDQLTTSPGAADMGGLFITPMAKDFDKISSSLLADVYEQVCFNDQEIKMFSDRIIL